MKKTHTSAAAWSAAALLALGAFHASAFTFDDIHYWVGEGTNRCALVVDWAGYGTTKAWGYRWNGEATNVAEIVSRVAHEDPRLKVGVQGMTSSFVDFYFFGYDVNDCHPTWDLVNGGASDPEACAHVEDFLYYSAWWVFYGPMNGTSLPTTPQYSSWMAANAVVPRNNDWFVFAYGSPEYDADWNESPAELAEPEPAESPYGYQVVAASTSAASALYNKAENVLGRPTMYMAGQWGGPISPYNPAWMAGEIFSLESEGDEELEPGEEDGPGYVTIAFDHDVVDDPANPYGIDFLVFGNAFAVGNSSEYYTQTTDPNKVSFAGTGAAEEALVEVSQDGRTWYAFAKGPFADGALPTLGYLYEPDRADFNLFAGNLYWGRAAQATRPVDPSVGFAQFKGLTLAQVCQAYNGSAGGTGYDLKDVDLPTQADRHDGRKWFRYVRLSSRYVDDNGEGDSGYTAPEIDAVADVAPVSPYELWVEQNYTDWTTAWQTAVTGPSAIAANGRANGVNFALGIAAAEATALDFRVASFTPGETMHELTLVSTAPLGANCGVVVKGADEPTAKNWTVEQPALEPSQRQADGTYSTVLRVSSALGRFLKLALDLE